MFKLNYYISLFMYYWSLFFWLWAFMNLSFAAPVDADKGYFMLHGVVFLIQVVCFCWFSIRLKETKADYLWYARNRVFYAEDEDSNA